MNNLKSLASIMLLVMFTAVTGCEKEGPIGPEGPQGQTGPAGPQGPQGPQGNANVSSATFTVSNWTYIAPSYRANIPYLAITSQIIANGAVLAYIKHPSNNSFSQLPVTFYQSSTYSTSIEVVSKVGGIELYWTDSDRVQPNFPGTWSVKIVVIASSALALNPDLNLASYEEVSKTFNLTD